MARINLLPWRAERRKQRQREFQGMLGLAALVAGDVEGKAAREIEAGLL